MSRVVINTMERASSRDAVLGPVLQRRDVDKDLAAMAMRKHRNGPPGTTAESTLDTLQPCVLGGLDVTIVSGSTLQVHPGRAVVTNPSPQTLTRPASWSGRVDADDYVLTRAELTTLTSVTPSSPITQGLLTREWWLVSASMTEKTIETTSALETLNASGGWSTSSAPKVKQHVLVPHVTRGTTGGPVPALPVGHIALAWVMVPAGATDLSAAVIFDTRRLVEDVGPNTVEGRWEVPLIGQLVAPYMTPEKVIFRGSVRARLGGEWLEARCYYGLGIPEIAEPGATWLAATPDNPRSAWLYLCKPRGVVPRPVRRGTASIGNHPGFPTDETFLSGALVLSPTPPRIGCGDASSSSGRRWDLRASAPLTLPDQTGISTLGYPWGGMAAEADDCICIGFMRYTGVDTGAGVPLVVGQMYCDEGWVSGQGLAGTPLVAHPLDGLLEIDSLGLNTPAAMVTAQLLGGVIAGQPRVMPLDGIRASIRFAVDSSSAGQWLTGRRSGELIRGILDDDGHLYVDRDIEEYSAAPGQKTIILASVLFHPLDHVTAITYRVTAAHIPYGEPLVG